MLDVRDIAIKFGGITALNSVSLSVKKDSITGLIGPNGAGKTTFFNCVTGIYKPTSGHAVFADEMGKEHNIFKYPHHRIIRLGMVRTFQNIRLFSKMSVLENILIGAYTIHSYSLLQTLFHTRTMRNLEHELIEHCHTVLRDLDLDHVANEIAESLPYGLQKRLEIARAIASRPSMVLLDEPAAGMNPKETEALMNLIRSLKSRYNFTVFLIEHDMHFVMNLCDTIYVVDYGRLIAQGTPEEVRNNPSTIEAYLGS